MAEDNELYKEVDFATYCKKCKYKDTSDGDDPCDICLETGARVGTRVPVAYKEK